MGELLSIIAIVVLLALVVVSVTQAARRHDAGEGRRGRTYRGRGRPARAIHAPPGRGKSGTARPGRLTAGPVSSLRAGSRP